MTALAIALSLCLPAAASALPMTGLWISEIMYDPVAGNDDGYQWIELFNATGSDIDLSGYSLGWGGSSYTMGTLQLSGTVSAGSYFIVGEANTAWDQLVDFAPGLQNPVAFSDGVALFDMTEAALLASSPTPNPSHAVIYGGFWNWNGLVDEDGNTAIAAGDAPRGQSIEFNGTAWGVQSAPVAGNGPLAVGEARTAWLLLSAVAFAMIRGRARSYR